MLSEGGYFKFYIANKDLLNDSELSLLSNFRDKNEQIFLHKIENGLIKYFFLKETIFKEYNIIDNKILESETHFKAIYTFFIYKNLLIINSNTKKDSFLLYKIKSILNNIEFSPLIIDFSKLISNLEKNDIEFTPKKLEINKFEISPLFYGSFSGKINNKEYFKKKIKDYSSTIKSITIKLEIEKKNPIAIQLKDEGVLNFFGRTKNIENILKSITVSLRNSNGAIWS